MRELHSYELAHVGGGTQPPETDDEIIVIGRTRRQGGFDIPTFTRVGGGSGGSNSPAATAPDDDEDQDSDLTVDDIIIVEGSLEFYKGISGQVYIPIGQFSGLSNEGVADILSEFIEDNNDISVDDINLYDGENQIDISVGTDGISIEATVTEGQMTRAFNFVLNALVESNIHIRNLVLIGR